MARRWDAAEWTESTGWRSLPGPLLGGDRCRPRTAAVGDDVFALLCGQAAVWSDAAQRWYTIASPNTVKWHSDACVPILDPTRAASVNVWCSLPEGNAFWRVDLDRVEATRYSEPATLSRWELLPNPAATRLDSLTMVWSGEELLYFSGHGIEVEESGGWGYAPSTNTMHRIPDAPYPGRHGQVALWTGEEMLVTRGPTTAWDPITLRWRTTAPSPALTATPSGAWSSAYGAWAGSEAIFYGSPFEPSNVGAAYNPETDTWRVMAIAPAAVAVGVEVFVSSGDEAYLLGSWSPGSRSQSAAVYTPATDRWRLLPRLPDGFVLSDAVGGFVDGEFIVVGVNSAEGPPVSGLKYSPASDTWTEIAPILLPTGLPGSMAGATHGDELAVFLPAEYLGTTATIAFYNPSTDTWRHIDGAPASAPHPTMVSGDTFIAYLTSAGTVLLHDG